LFVKGSKLLLAVCAAAKVISSDIVALGLGLPRVLEYYSSSKLLE